MCCPSDVSMKEKCVMKYTVYVKGTAVMSCRTLERAKQECVFHGKDAFIMPHEGGAS